MWLLIHIPGSMLYFRKPSDDLSRKLNVHINIFESVTSEQVLVKYQERQLVSKEFLQNKHFFALGHVICVGGFLQKTWIFLPHLNKQLSSPFSISFQVAEMLLITIYKYVRQSCE